MAKPSPWRASAGVFVLFALLGVGFAVVLWANSRGLVAGVAVAVATIAVVYPAYLQAAYRLSWALGEFAGQVPGEPEPAESVHGDQSLRWPDLGLSVEGGTHKFRVTGLVAEADGREWTVAVSRPREGARRVLESLDRQPAFDRFEDRLPSIYPRLSALKVAVPTTFLGLVAVALGGPLLAGDGYPRWWLVVGALAGVLVGAVRWNGLVGVRRALVDLGDGLHDAGVELDRIDRIEGHVRLQFAIHTGQGTTTLRCVALPGGRLTVGHGDRERAARFDDARALGRGVGEWLRGTSVGGGDGEV